jgi:hypothetical protein
MDDKVGHLPSAPLECEKASAVLENVLDDQREKLMYKILNVTLLPRTF